MSSYKIPSSLKWLIRNRQRIAGRLTLAKEDFSKLEKELQKAQTIYQKYEVLKNLIPILEIDLAAIERTLQLHEVAVDINKLSPLRPQRNPSAFKHGQLTKWIYSALGSQSAQWVSTNEIFAHISSRINSNVPFDSKRSFRQIVYDQLKGLSKGGKIDRVLTDRRSRNGLWRMKPSHRGGLTYSAIPAADDDLANIHESNPTNLIFQDKKKSD